MTLSLARRNKKTNDDADYDHSKFHKLKRQLFPWSSSAHDKSRRSSIGAFFQSFCSHEQPLFDARRRRSTSSFANDALFEKYRYKKQSTIDLSRSNQSQSAPPSSIPSNHDDDDEEEAMTPRVVCWQDDKLPQGILVKHRHTASLQYSSPHLPLHRRSKSTATHIRHYSHVSYISSSNITAHSEDLTAKEFADIAGIKILPEDDNQSQHNELTVEDNNDQVSLDEECASVKSSGLSAVKPTIMDDAFWRNESTSTKSSDEEEGVVPIAQEDVAVPLPQEEDVPPLPRLLPPLPPQRKIIKKGRFEIHVESAA